MIYDGGLSVGLKKVFVDCPKELRSNSQHKVELVPSVGTCL